MAIQIIGSTSGNIAEIGVAAASPLHVAAKPTPYGALGHYRIAQRVPLVATQAANGVLLAFRWTHASNLAVIQKIRLTLMQTVAATATIMPRFQVFIARSFSTFYTTNATAVTLTGNNMKKRTSMGTTLLANLAYSNGVAAGMTGGSLTLDSAPIVELPINFTITTPNPTPYANELDIGMADGNHPFVFTTNEGFIVQGPTVVFGAAGTADLIVEVGWAEVTTF